MYERLSTSLSVVYVSALCITCTQRFLHAYVIIMQTKGALFRGLHFSELPAHSAAKPAATHLDPHFAANTAALPPKQRVNTRRGGFTALPPAALQASSAATPFHAE